MKFIGVDVSKGKLDCAAVTEAGEVLDRSRSFKNTKEGICALLKWCRKISDSDGLRVVIEATAAYHEMVALHLSEANVFVAIVNPFHVRSLARGLAILGKTDALDAVVLGHYGRFAKLRKWVAPAADLVALKASLLRLDAIEADLLREQNRREQALVRQSSPAIIRSMDASIRFLKRQRKSMQRVIEVAVETAPDIAEDVARLRTIPGVGEKTANRMTAVLRLHDFKSARQASAFLGLVPVEHRSGTSVYRKPRLSKAGNPKIRAGLYMAAVVAMRVNPDIKALYERLVARGKPKMAALGACMRKLVHICFGVLRSRRQYEPQVRLAS